MKRIVLVSIMVIALAAGVGYAQMGGEMMGGQQGQKGQGGMMMHEQQMSGDMMQMMQHMCRMMEKTSGMMKGMGPENMMKMSETMKDMSKHMMDMSNMMHKGSVSQEHKHNLQQKMMKTDKELDMMMK